MAEQHEAIEELLAGYVLRSLSGEDAARADRVLSDHVPGCPACRDTLSVFRGVTSDLALDAAPVTPPETLLPRLHRELGEPALRRRPAGAFAIAAGVVAVVGLVGLTVAQGLRANNAQARAGAMAAALDLASRPDASLVTLADDDQDRAPITEISAPGVEEFYLVGDIPPPPPGSLYRVWLASDSTFTWAGDFVPSDGLTVFHLEYDPNRYDRVMITIAQEGSEPVEPGDVVWQAAS